MIFFAAYIRRKAFHWSGLWIVRIVIAFQMSKWWSLGSWTLEKWSMSHLSGSELGLKLKEKIYMWNQWNTFNCGSTDFHLAPTSTPPTHTHTHPSHPPHWRSFPNGKSKNQIGWLVLIGRIGSEKKNKFYSNISPDLPICDRDLEQSSLQYVNCR